MKNICTTLMVLVLFGTIFGCATRIPLQIPLCEPSIECDLEWEAWNKQEDRAALKRQWEALIQCPDGYVFVCDASWCKPPFTPNKIPKRSADWIGSGCATAASVRKAYGL